MNELDDRRARLAAAKLVQEALSLNDAARIAHTDPREAFDMLGSIEDSLLLTYLRAGVCGIIYQAMKGPRESDVRKRFYENLEGYLPGAKSVQVKIIPGAIPDGFLIWKERKAPVEVKLHCFDEKALSQLRRYMEAYDADLGVAVAPSLACDLPENIHFVEVRV